MMPTATQVWLVVEPIDMRAGIDGLSQRIQNTLGRSPCDGNAYAFRNRRQNRLKLLIWDGTGVWLCQRRLHRGHFVWPRADTPVLHPQRRTVAMARHRRGLATLGSAAAGPLAGVAASPIRVAFAYSQRDCANPVSMRLAAGFSG